MRDYYEDYDLRIIVLPNCEQFGASVNEELKRMRKNKDGFIVPISVERFSNGEGKGVIKAPVRYKDVYIISDVGNYDISYNFHGRQHAMTPDEHFQDIKRVVSAICGHAERISVVMPLLYQSRQHKRVREGRESLDCPIALQELVNLGVRNIITYDVHAPNVANAIPTRGFENCFPTHIILSNLINQERDIFDNIQIVSPDEGAIGRARYYSDIIGCGLAHFQKRRDYSQVVNGKNPIKTSEYIGSSVAGKNVILVDDMISSGESMVKAARKLKEMGAEKIFLIATFALFTEGTEIFEKAYEEGLFYKAISTNLSYIPSEIQDFKWFEVVDCAPHLAKVINTLNMRESIEEFNEKDRMYIISKIRNR